VFANEGEQFECCPCGSDGGEDNAVSDGEPMTEEGGDASHE
jgi:hypothetical protein